MSYGKSSGSSTPAVSSGGFRPSPQAQQQFQSTAARQQPDLAQQLNQIAGSGSPAVSTMVNQQMAPQGATGPAPQPQQAVAGATDLYNQYSGAVFGNPQQQQIKAQTDFFTGTLPQQQLQTYQTAVQGATNLYNQSAPQAQSNGNQTSTAMTPQQLFAQYSDVIMGTPESAYRPNFQNEITPEQRQQIDAQRNFFTDTIAPTYQQAVTGATDLYNQGATGVSAAMTPQNLYNQYSSVIFGTPGQAYQPNFQRETTPEQQAQIAAQRDFFTGTL
jgi:hypothetical protein